LYCKVCLVVSNGFTSFFVFSCRVDECFLLVVVVFGGSSSSSAASAPGRRLSVFGLRSGGGGRGVVIGRRTIGARARSKIKFEPR
jgi:hypothetical protein